MSAGTRAEFLELITGELRKAWTEAIRSGADPAELRRLSEQRREALEERPGEVLEEGPGEVLEERRGEPDG